MKEGRGETGGGRRGGRRDTEAEIGDGPVSQTVSGLLCFELMDRYQLIDSLFFLSFGKKSPVGTEATQTNFNSAP